MARSIKTRQRRAQTRADEAQRLKQENPDKSLSWIAEQLGVTKQRVSQLLSPKKAPASAWANSDDRWPPEMVTMMVEQLRAGVAPRDLLDLPGVADMIRVKVSDDDLDPERVAELGRSKALAEVTYTKRTAALRTMISRGQYRPRASVAGRLYEARQIGLGRRRSA